MLIIERTSNGTNIVRLRKDWNPSRIGRAYTPPAQTQAQPPAATPALFPFHNQPRNFK